MTSTTTNNAKNPESINASIFFKGFFKGAGHKERQKVPQSMHSGFILSHHAGLSNILDHGCPVLELKFNVQQMNVKTALYRQYIILHSEGQTSRKNDNNKNMSMSGTSLNFSFLTRHSN